MRPLFHGPTDDDHHKAIVGEHLYSRSLIMPETDSENARQVLRTALAAEDIAKMRFQAIVDAVDRAKMFLTEAEDDLRGFADVDQKLTAYRAGKIKEWSVSGGERPSLDLPADLAVAREAKMGAEERIAAARVAYDGLTDELQTAKQAGNGPRRRCGRPQSK